MLQRYDYRDPRVPDGHSNRYGADGYPIFDRQNGIDKPVAVCTDVDQAQRIVDLLNASDEKRKEPR